MMVLEGVKDDWGSQRGWWGLRGYEGMMVSEGVRGGQRGEGEGV